MGSSVEEDSALRESGARLLERQAEGLAKIARLLRSGKEGDADALRLLGGAETSIKTVHMALSILALDGKDI